MTVFIFITVILVWLALCLLFSHPSQRGRVDNERAFIVNNDTVVVSPEHLATLKRVYPTTKEFTHLGGMKVVTSNLCRPKTGWDYE